MKKPKWPIDKYHINSDENPCCCFQVTRRTIYYGFNSYIKETVFLPKSQNTLGYLAFTCEGKYEFYDEYIAVWKIKSLKLKASGDTITNPK